MGGRMLGRFMCWLGLHVALLDEDDAEVLDQDGCCICARCGWRGFPTF